MLFFLFSLILFSRIRFCFFSFASFLLLRRDFSLKLQLALAQVFLQIQQLLPKKKTLNIASTSTQLHYTKYAITTIINGQDNKRRLVIYITIFSIFIKSSLLNSPFKNS